MKILTIPRAFRVLSPRGFFCLGTSTLLILSQFLLVYVQPARSAPLIVPADATPNSGTPSFLTPKLRLWKGRSQVICFQLSQTATQDQTFSCQVDEKLVQILMPPRILTGEKIGYMRVQALAEGSTRLDLNGAKLEVNIVTDPAFTAVSTFNLHIISPADGATAWGDFSVGVEQMTVADPACLPVPVLHLSNGKEVTGQLIPDKKPSQYGRWVYDLKQGDLSPGPNHLVAVTTDVEGRPIESNSIQVDQVSPSSATTLTGLCKETLQGDYPARAGGGGTVVKDAQNGDVVQGVWSLPLWITKEQAGRYQMVLTVRGDLGGDGLPSFGMAIDEDGQSGTAVRLATTDWRRLPVGHPIVLNEGGHMLSVRLGNQFGQGPDDHRSLYLQKYELARLDVPSGSRVAANGADMGDPTLPMNPSAPSMMEMNSSRTRITRELHIFFTDNLDGQMVAGTLDFGAKCWWPSQELHAPPPKSELYVNHKLASSQNVAAPHFTVDPSAFVRGANTLQLRAVLPSGLEARSAEFTVEVPADFPLPLTPSGPSVDATPPVIALSYAPTDVGEGKVDAVVARVMDNRKVAAADLVIDNQPGHLDLTPLHGVGPLVFPLLTRDLKPGPHHFKVIAHDEAGNQASSLETAFTISPSPVVLSRYQRAVTLLNRFAYGPEPRELAEILTKGEIAWLQARMALGVTTPGEMNLQEMLRVQYGHPQREGEVITDGIQYLLNAPNPVRARFLMWTENHFSTWIRKEGLIAKGQEHDNFLRLGPAPFFDLLFTSSTSPGMLFYLDQINSFANRLNENYAREIMELHTLGVKGGYTQADVTTLAGLLTGWTLAAQSFDDGTPGGQGIRYFGYDPHLNDGKPCRIFGMEFPVADPAKRFDRVLMALEMLSAHPSCAKFISRKLCEEYVSDPAPPAIVDALAQVYLETGGDMNAMLVAMSQHPDFWAAPPKVANPIDFAIRDSRLARSDNTQRVAQFLSQSGMGMFDRATPDGYPADDGYSVNTNALLQRWRFSLGVQTDFLNSGLIPTSLRPPDAAWPPDTTQRLLDLAAVRITGNTLSPTSNEAARKLLADAQGDTAARLRTLTTFICQLPENSLK